MAGFGGGIQSILCQPAFTAPNSSIGLSAGRVYFAARLGRTEDRRRSDI
jgi:hypothetical protein